MNNFSNSEKTLVSSVVGYFHDVIGTGDHYSKQHSHGNRQHQQQQQHNIVQSGQSTLLSKMNTNSPSSVSEIKEQVEWLHFENINLLCNTSYTTSSWNLYNNNSNKPNTGVRYQNFNFANSNILLVLGYKTGFSIWIIDVSLFFPFILFYFYHFNSKQL
jgi:hypothetical protein